MQKCNKFFLMLKTCVPSAVLRADYEYHVEKILIKIFPEVFRFFRKHGEKWVFATNTHRF